MTEEEESPFSPEEKSELDDKLSRHEQTTAREFIEDAIEELDKAISDRNWTRVEEAIEDLHEAKGRLP